MKDQVGFKPVVKLVVFWAVFMVLYFLYRTFPVFPLSIISGITESNFQHYKATFFAFLIVDGIEWLVYRKRITDGQGFWYGRLLTAVIAPWIVFLLWYIAPALYGQFPATWMEIVYANLITLLATVVTLTLERGFLTMTFSRELKMVVWGLALVALLLYMVFTFSHLPWADVFVEPQWR